MSSFLSSSPSLRSVLGASPPSTTASPLDDDLAEIAKLMRSRLEIRNRSWMKRVHKNCFLGTDAVTWIVEQGFTETRAEGVALGRRMMVKRFIRHVTDGQPFRDDRSYYRFALDEPGYAEIADFAAGNGNGVHYGQGGCKWSIAPHTAHNSYILNIALSEELERAVAGASIDTRRRAVNRLRNEVRNESKLDAPYWDMVKTQMVNGILVSVYHRKRPRGPFYNMKVTGKSRTSPRSFIASMLDFSRRKDWEATFLDGVVVEAVDIGEETTFLDDGENPPASPLQRAASIDVSQVNVSNFDEPEHFPVLASSNVGANKDVARPVDNVEEYLSRVNLSLCPEGMPIALLNDPLRQEALSHLRRQMMASDPENCILCNAFFTRPGDMRFCPCCGMCVCASCGSKKVFEVLSCQEACVCVHCFRESSRIRHPPQVIANTSTITQRMRGKWWRASELGLVDFSHSHSQVQESSSLNILLGENSPAQGGPLLATLDQAEPTVHSLARVDEDVPHDEATEQLEEGIARNSEPADVFVLYAHADATEMIEAEVQPSNLALDAKRYARCKMCGGRVERTVEAMETHSDTCQGQSKIGEPQTQDTSNILGGILRRPELMSASTRIVYRTANPPSKLFRPREVCTFQDCFMDPDGTCYAYEFSVRHVDVRGTEDFVTAEVLLLLHVARPIPGKPNMCDITVISQVDSKARAPAWVLSMITDYATMGNSMQANIVRELAAQKDLPDLLSSPNPDTDGPQDGSHKPQATLDDFELMCVLGRGGFGKVMQVRHKQTNKLYAMKILKKQELKKRRQVERTRTERTILANVNHPFIVRLWFAFQNDQKLYMVMDFVQGGDFFTMMRKFRRMPEPWVQLYVAEIALALQHLHDMDIVYRDLKPENVLLEGDGHVKLTDFGLSRYFETRPALTEDAALGTGEALTKSFCGTEQYMSPEMLLQQGHNWKMDWWCLGLLMHEMITARHPFQGPSHYDTLRNMVTKAPTIDARVSASASLLIRALLIKNAKSRLGCRDGISELKEMAFFEGLDWDAVLDKRLPAPYIPPTANAADVTNFEAQFTREQPIDSRADGDREQRGGGLMGFFGFEFGGESKQKEEGSDQQFSGFSFVAESIVEGSNTLHRDSF